MSTHLQYWGTAAAALLSLLGGGCSADVARQPAALESAIPGGRETMKLTSRQFEHGAEIPATFTVEGQDISPPLAWSDVPAQTRSFALICDDPDAPTPQRPAREPWVHWVLFNIPADRTALDQAISQTSEPAEVKGARQGKNSWPDDNIGYRGPAPPPGSGRHRYFFKLYALDTSLDLPAGATKQQLLAAMSGHLLGEGQLMGTYER